MNNKEFEQFWNFHISQISKLMLTKQAEYAEASGEDRFSNFHNCARILDTTAPSALIGMLVKHWESIISFEQRHREGIHTPLEKWKEKVYDNIIYSLLLLGIMEDEFESVVQNGTKKESVEDDLLNHDKSVKNENIRALLMEKSLPIGYCVQGSKNVFPFISISRIELEDITKWYPFIKIVGIDGLVYKLIYASGLLWTPQEGFFREGNSE